MTSVHLMSLDPTARESYLNSNDAQSPADGKVIRKLCRIRFLSDDPRSPSAGIVRTPIQVRILVFRQFSPVSEYCKQFKFKITKHVFILLLASYLSTKLTLSKTTSTA
jgi:hypothetical protein